jgi:oligogalacturonide lyase
MDIVGRTWQSEKQAYTDPISGIRVSQLTQYLGHSHHIYFTNTGWYQDGEFLLFSSDRENRTNLFSLHLETGEIMQVTNLNPLPPPYEVDFLLTTLNPTRPVAYFFYGNQVMSLDLRTFDLEVLWEFPEGFFASMINATADGEYICFGVFQNLSSDVRMDLGRGYIGFEEIWKAKPTSRIYKLRTDGKHVELLWEEQYWISHVNTSPTQPHLLSFCHEGPWDKVDNRIWVIDTHTKQATPVRKAQPEETVGHEFWFHDGNHIGYHGTDKQRGSFFGKIRYDNTEQTEVPFQGNVCHLHSLDFSYVVGDSTKHIYLWRWNGKGFDGPRILCEHRCSMHIQKLHVHPRFNPTGDAILFTSDMKGYGNLYEVRIPDFDALPKVSE